MISINKGNNETGHGLLKLGEEHAMVMHRSMKSFKDHVSSAHHSVLVDFIFSMPVKGLTY